MSGKHTVQPPPSVSMSQYTRAGVEVFHVVTSYTPVGNEEFKCSNSEQSAARK